MNSLLLLKEQIKKIFIEYEEYATPVFKFLFSLITLLLINGKIGYMDKIDSLIIVIVVSLMCSFMPKNFILIVSAIFVLAHFYELSIEVTLVTAIVFGLIFLLYLCFLPKDGIVVLLLPLCFMLNVPFIIPIVVGLTMTPLSIISVSCGTIVHFLIQRTTENLVAIETMTEEDALQKIKFILDGILVNTEMYIVIISFAVTIIVVNFIKRLSIDYAWTIAIVTGATVNIMILLIGDLIFDTNISILGTIVGMVISVVLAKMFQILNFHLDYSRTERVQFEDDEYYYYVKAVPKISLSKADKKVKRINTSRNSSVKKR